MAAAGCLKHAWLEEGDSARSRRGGKIKLENLRKFLARRKVQNVGRVLAAISVFRETARDSRSR